MDMPSEEAQALYRVFEEQAVSREEVQRKAEIVSRNAHRYRVLTLKVGPHAGKCLIWLECPCTDPEGARCSVIQYN